jgi:hypothetical protein
MCIEESIDGTALPCGFLEKKVVGATNGLRQALEKSITREPKINSGPCRCVMTSPASLMGAVM